MTGKEKKLPSLPVRAHTYIPDPTEGADWHGDRPCLTCRLSKANRVHEYELAGDDSARIVGESGE